MCTTTAAIDCIQNIFEKKNHKTSSAANSKGKMTSKWSMSANSKFYIPNCSSRSVVSRLNIHLAQVRCEA
jgi:hypothetical protein